MAAPKPLPSVGRGRKPGTKLAYAPRSEGEKAKRTVIPPEPTVPRAEDKAANDVQQAARVEMLMIKGLRSERQIMALLGIETEKECKRLIGLVFKRWEITGNGRDIKKHRGEALVRLDVAESELWSALADLGNVQDPLKAALGKATLMGKVMDIQKERSQLLGLTPRVLERIALMPETGTNSIAAKLQAQTGLSIVADRFLEILASRRERLGVPTTIDHEPAEDYSEDAEMTAH